MAIDIPTILMLELTTALIAALILTSTRSHEDSAGLTSARGAMLALVPAFGLQLSRGRAPDVIVILGANILFWLACALIYTAYARFAGAPRTPRWPFVWVGVAGIMFIVLWSADAPYGMRAAFTSLNIAGLLTAAAFVLPRNGGFAQEPARRVSFALIALVAVPMWIRLGVLVPQLWDDLNPLRPSLETALGFFPAVLLVQGFGLAFLMMQHERGEARAHLQAITDPLTACMNRRALEDRVRTEQSYAVRARRPFAVLVVDLDHFKKINDGFGHPAGDAVLVYTASVLRSLVRPSDVVARYGGEEFCLLLRDTDITAAGVVAERVVSTLRAENIVFEGKTIPVTASIGVAVADMDNAEGWDALFKRADEALYRAKAGGRNRFELAAGSVI